VIGSERHESRRIDNQLRGRCARQGDPGSTRFYLSLDDNLMRIFAPPKLKNIMMKLGMGHGEAIESRLVTRSIENAQRKVEGHNFDIRKNLLQFDDVANEQRKVIYEQRREIMHSDDLAENVKVLREDVISGVINKFIPPNSVEELWDVPGLEKQLEQDFNLALPIQKWLDEDDQLYEETLRHKIIEQFELTYQEKEKMASPTVIRQFEKAVMLQQLDLQWKDHLAAMDYLRQGINLRGYAARDPRQEYKREAFKLFEMMLDRVKYDIISILSRFQVRAEEDVEALEEQRRQSNHSNVEFKHAEIDALSGEEAVEQNDEKVVSISSRQNTKPGRNDACYCGSGKKYKQCHGQIE
jgi:preprotein translocase subunit SecA